MIILEICFGIGLTFLGLALPHYFDNLRKIRIAMVVGIILTLIGLGQLFVGNPKSSSSENQQVGVLLVDTIHAFKKLEPKQKRATQPKPNSSLPASTEWIARPELHFSGIYPGKPMSVTHNYINKGNQPLKRIAYIFSLSCIKTTQNQDSTLSHNFKEMNAYIKKHKNSGYVLDSGEPFQKTTSWNYALTKTDSIEIYAGKWQIYFSGIISYCDMNDIRYTYSFCYLVSSDSKFWPCSKFNDVNTEHCESN